MRVLVFDWLAARPAASAVGLLTLRIMKEAGLAFADTAAGYRMLQHRHARSWYDSGYLSQSRDACKRRMMGCSKGICASRPITR